MKEEFHLIDQLEIDQFLSRDEWIFLIEHRSDALERYLFEKSEAVRIREYGHDIYIRGLIEFTNYCHNDCYYCGIRKSNPNILRYRLSPSEILSCCHIGYELGFRTFVLQGGEDNWFTTKRMAEIVAEIHSHFPDCAITLSIGERFTGKAIRLCSMRVLTVICSVMKHMTLSITAGFILIRFLPFTDGNAFGI